MNTQKTLKNINPYLAGKSKITGKKGVIKLSSNESPFGPSANVLAKIKTISNSTNRYPESGSLKLKDSISKRYNLNRNNIFCANGSDEILGLICQLYLTKGDEVIIPKNSFLMYEIYSKINNAKVINSKTLDYRVDTKNILKNINKKTKIIFIANPNNPTGLYIDKFDLDSFIKKIPKRIIIVLDAAYAEYLNNHDYENGMKYVRGNNNVIVTRTFSKIYGLASLRLGWCYANLEIIALLDKIRGPFNVNSIAQEAGAIAILEKGIEKKLIAHNEKWLKKIKTEFIKLPVTVYDSQANFIFIKLVKGVSQQKKLNKHLLSHSIIIRTLDNYNMSDCIRVTIGTEKENKLLINSFKSFFKNEK
jgi:histidinol-phosphate aminotransferase